MYSMTGFGKTELTIDGRRMRVEIKSVNHRFLDINIRMPRFLLYLEDEARKIISSRLARGRVDVFINYSSERDDAKKVVLNKGIISAYWEASKEIKAEFGLADDIATIDLMRLPDAVAFEDNDNDEEAFRNLLEQTMNGALDELVAARKSEGEKLMADINSRLDVLLDAAKSISALEDVVVSDYKTKLTERLNALLDGASVDESRLAQEVAIFADKCNITEELVRISSHIERFKNADKQEGPQGRNLDFIVQELNREFNTIGSKANFVEITNSVITAKGEIEKIREQIQNIE